uniref:Enoyl-CoA hydratase/carnithine racemase-like protein n=1 Tax=Rhodopseudomonas palustris (strain BisA53) TaxID=316055 RepID=Q07Q65_RHOP5
MRHSCAGKTPRNGALILSDGSIARILRRRENPGTQLKALRSAFADIATDKSVKVLIISGSGPAFCAGHDLKELRASNYDPTYVDALFAECAEVMQAIVHWPKPVNGNYRLSGMSCR